MSIMLNQPKSIFRVIKEGITLYLSNFLSLTKPMIYPVVAHLIGISWILWVSIEMPTLFNPEFFVNNGLLIAGLIIVGVIPGFLLFLNGFWKYLIAMVALNRYIKAIIEKDQAIKYSACHDHVNNKKKKYIYVLCLMMLLWIIGFIITILPAFLGIILPPFVVILAIIAAGIFSTIVVLVFSVYFSMGFQVLAFEETGIIEVLKRSFEIIEKNFFRTLFLLVFLYIITGILLPFIAHYTLELIGIVGLLEIPVHSFSASLLNAIDNLYRTGSNIAIDNIYSSLHMLSTEPASFISRNIVIITIDGIITAGMLPLGTACFTLLYFDIINKKRDQVEN